MKVCWMKTAPRTYMSQSITDGKGDVYFVIKGIDDLFFIYSKRADHPVTQHGFTHRFSEAKDAVQAAVDSAQKAMEVAK